MIINFRQGIVQQLVNSQNQPAFLTAGTSVSGSITVSLVASSANPTIVDFTQGQSDYLFQEAANVTNAWVVPVTSPNNAWLYWDINQLTGIRTFGFTRFLPVEAATAPTQSTKDGTTYTSLQADQHWYDTVNFLMKVWNGNVWVVNIRCFAGYILGGVNSPPNMYPVGTQVGLTNTQTSAGFLLFDDNNNPVKKFQPFNLGEFITTATPLASQFSQIQNYRLETAVRTAAASSTIAQFKAVCYTAADQIGPASCNNLLAPAVGVVVHPIYAGQVTDFIVGGYIVDPLGKFNTNYTYVVGGYVFVDSNGFLAPAPCPTTGSAQRVGLVVDPNTIYISIQPQIIYQ
jgi:hypothetical protein